jgi:putative drug exporter of the RND superfamily
VSFLGIKIGAADSTSLAHSGAAYQTFQTLEKGGVTTGVLTPMEVLTETDKAQTVADALGRVDGVTRVDVPTGLDASVGGRTVVLVFPDRETVNSQSVQVVRDVTGVADKTDGVIGVAGLGNAQVDFLHAVYGNFPLMLLIISVLTYLLLARAFRSLLLPLKAVILNLLSLTAVFGLMVLFWQKGYGSDAVFGIAKTGAVTFWIPLMVFAFLFGLSMDYEVFILARIREAYDAGASTDDAVIEGIGRTGRLVTSAALILFLAFAALASGPGTDLKVMATGLGFGILLDATLVRSVLVPSLVSLFGSWNWMLPDAAARVLRIEKSHPHAEREPAPVGD